MGANKIFNKVKAVLVMLSGIVIMTCLVGVALSLSLHSWPSVVLTLVGTFFGTVMIFGSVRQFSKWDFRAESEELAKSEQARIAIESELSDEKAKNARLAQELDAERKNNLELEHRLTIFANVTKIQPAFKIVPAEIDFDITDFSGERPINESAAKKHPITGNYHKEQDFYRGVYKYSGKVHLMVDLAKINLCETDDEIIIYGPFAYSQACEPQEEKWLLPGRREHVLLRGESEDDMEVDEITVTKTMDRKGEEKQVALVRESVKHLKMIDQMRMFTDNIVKNMIELMLRPTGKQIRFIESTPAGVPDLTSLKPLGEFISDFNRRIENRKPIAE